MIKERLYCIFDIKSEQFYPPYASANDATGDRKFIEILTDETSELAKHPEDYRLFAVGEFERESGRCIEFEKGIVCVNPGLTIGRPADVARAEEEAVQKFRLWMASRGLEVSKGGEVRQLDRGGM